MFLYIGIARDGSDERELLACPIDLTKPLLYDRVENAWHHVRRLKGLAMQGLPPDVTAAMHVAAIPNDALLFEVTLPATPTENEDAAMQRFLGLPSLLGAEPSGARYPLTKAAYDAFCAEHQSIRSLENMLDEPNWSTRDAPFRIAGKISDPSLPYSLEDALKEVGAHTDPFRVIGRAIASQDVELLQRLERFYGPAALPAYLVRDGFTNTLHPDDLIELKSPDMLRHLVSQHPNPAGKQISVYSAVISKNTPLLEAAVESGLTLMPGDACSAASTRHLPTFAVFVRQHGETLQSNDDLLTGLLGEPCLTKFLEHAIEGKAFGQNAAGHIAKAITQKKCLPENLDALISQALANRFLSESDQIDLLNTAMTFGNIAAVTALGRHLPADLRNATNMASTNLGMNISDTGSPLTSKAIQDSYTVGMAAMLRATSEKPDSWPAPEAMYELLKKPKFPHHFMAAAYLRAGFFDNEKIVASALPSLGIAWLIKHHPEPLALMPLLNQTDAAKVMDAMVGSNNTP